MVRVRLLRSKTEPYKAYYRRTRVRKVVEGICGYRNRTAYGSCYNLPGKKQNIKRYSHCSAKIAIGNAYF